MRHELHELFGKWEKGYAFDLHTFAATYDEFGSEQSPSGYSKMGKLVYQLKYNEDKSAIPKIIELLKAIPRIEKSHFIIPVPPSVPRIFQPVDEIAKALGKQRGVPVLVGFLTKESRGKEMKNITDPDEKEKLLRDAIKIVGDRKLEGKIILLVDDIYDSGATLNACCSALEGVGARWIGVLTMTKTRMRR